MKLMVPATIELRYRLHPLQTAYRMPKYTQETDILHPTRMFMMIKRNQIICGGKTSMTK